MLKKQKPTTLFKTPFHKEYWRLALSEFTDLRTLIVAAMIIALRVAVKPLNIYITEAVKISLDFLVNSVGSMIYGPIVGLLVGAASDTLGCLLFPSGAYFFPFIFVEMSSSFIFGLFLYRARMSHLRTILSRFSVVAFCNLILNQIIMKWYYILVLGKDYTIFRMTRLVKNGALLPFDCLLLILWLGLISRITRKLGLTYSNDSEKQKITWKDGLFIGILTVISAVCIYCYIKFK